MQVKKEDLKNIHIVFNMCAQFWAKCNFLNVPSLLKGTKILEVISIVKQGGCMFF